MTRKWFHAVAVVVLAAMFAGNAGAVCSMASSPASRPTSHCHRHRLPQVPVPPEPSHYGCCASGHTSAVLTDIFSPNPALSPIEAAITLQLPVVARDHDSLTTSTAASLAAAGVFALRI
jgi:hypothetical protein